MVKTGYEFNDEFMQTTRDFYGAGLEQLDFSGDSEGARVHINDWVSKQTNNKIENLLKEGTITRTTVMALVNAIYFKESGSILLMWRTLNQEVLDIMKTKVTDMDMMLLHKQLRYKDLGDLNAKFLELPYVGGGCCHVYNSPK